VFDLDLYPPAKAALARLRQEPALQKRFKAVSKALRLLASNPRHPGLQTHEWHGDLCPHGGKMFEAYAENRTPGAYRIFWCYAPTPRTILVIDIVPHP